jgi:hypothetical protein
MPPKNTTAHNAMINNVVISSLPPDSRSKLCGCFTVVYDLGVELANAIAPLVVLAEFYLCRASESFLFQGVQL